jgi:uncharacterized protein YydD (DUF2326 family)
MLHRLAADDPRFRTVEFRPGLNILAAQSTEQSTVTDSRNGLGTSSMVELLHFLLGGQAKPSDLVRCDALRNWTFTLELTGHPETDEVLTVKRTGADPSTVWLQASPTAPDGRGLRLADWQRRIEADLFGLAEPHPGLSGRMLLSFLIRRASSHGFNSPVQAFPRQRDVDATPNLAYLLGLDVGLAEKYKQLADRRAARQDLKKASADPNLLGAVVGTTGDLKGEIGVLKSDIEEYRRRAEEFQVVPQYEDLRERADEINRTIQDQLNQDFADRRNLEVLERAIADSVDPEVKYLEQVYADLGITLPGEVSRRFDEVREFHAAVVRNRRGYLQQDLADTRERLAGRSANREQLGRELAEVVKQLQNGGALEGLQLLQNELAKRQAELTQAEKQLAIAESLQASTAEIKAAEADLRRQAVADLTERSRQIDEANRLFLELTRRMYGGSHKGYLSIEPTAGSLKITPKIDADDSMGISHVSIFCFDMTLAILAKRGGRGPDFLVHDSHLFDGVDERQLKHALEAAAELTEREQFQYVLTINEDDLSKAVALGFDAGRYTIQPRLTDASPDGGLFGFRFDR